MRSLIIFVILLASCISIPRIEIPKQLEPTIEEKVTSQPLKAPPTSSQDAMKQLEALKVTYSQAEAFVKKTKSDIKQKYGEYKRLRSQEISDSIAYWSKWGMAFSALLVAIGIFIGIRFMSAFGWSLAITGGILFVLSLTCLLIAPYWSALAWWAIIGGGGATICYILYHRHVKKKPQ